MRFVALADGFSKRGAAAGYYSKWSQLVHALALPWRARKLNTAIVLCLGDFVDALLVLIIHTRTLYRNIGGAEGG